MYGERSLAMISSTDAFCATGQREPTGQHAFDQVCAKHGIEHRLIRPRHPQTNGMIERFNGRVSEVLQTTRFRFGEHLRDTLTRYVRLYSQHIPQRALKHLGDFCQISCQLTCLDARLPCRTANHMARLCSCRSSLKANLNPASSGTRFSGNRLKPHRLPEAVAARATWALSYAHL